MITQTLWLDKLLTGKVQRESSFSTNFVLLSGLKINRFYAFKLERNRLQSM